MAAASGRDALVLQWLDLPAAMARQRTRRGWGIPFDDLRAEGFVALLRAATKWDESAGVPFKKYAVIVIHRHLTRFRTAEYKWLNRAGELGAEPGIDDDAGTPHETWAAARAAVADPRQWRLLWGHFVDGVSVREIGREFGVSHTRAGVLLRRAVAAVRDKVAESGWNNS